MNARDPRHQLTAIAELANALLVGWPQYEATEAALATSTIPSHGAGTHGGDIADPVAAIAISHERYYETAGELTEALGHLRAAQRTMHRVRGLQVDTSTTANAIRCDGVIGDDPTCTRNSVRNLKGPDRHDHPTCWACIKRAQRANDALDDDASDGITDPAA